MSAKKQFSRNLTNILKTCTVKGGDIFFYPKIEKRTHFIITWGLYILNLEEQKH